MISALIRGATTLGKTVTSGASRKTMTKAEKAKKLSSMDRAAEAYKRKEFLADAPRTSQGMPIPQLSSPDKLKGNLMRNLKKFSDTPQKIQTKPQLPKEDVFSRRPVE